MCGWSIELYVCHIAKNIGGNYIESLSTQKVITISVHSASRSDKTFAGQVAKLTRLLRF